VRVLEPFPQQILNTIEFWQRATSRSAYFPPSLIATFVKAANTEGGKCVTHCQQGISRSSTGAIDGLIINQRMNMASAFALVRGTSWSCCTKSDLSPGA
jgi:predicted protein tyrosine phosphatase